jgi:DNA-binding NarL/FixJ family response regulator
MEHRRVVRVIVAGDHAIFRRGVRDLLSEDDRIRVAAETTAGPDLLAEAIGQHPDVVVLDVHTADERAFENAKRLHQILPETHVVFLSASDSDSQLLQAILSGASGYLIASNSPDEIRDAVRNASVDMPYLPAATALRLLQTVLGEKRYDNTRESAQSLTDQDRTLLRVLAEGTSQRDIAAMLSSVFREYQFDAYLSKQAVAA